MQHRWKRNLGVAVAIAAGSAAAHGCGAAEPPQSAPSAGERAGPHAPRIADGAYVRARGTVLSALQGRVAGMRVQRTLPCPQITLRGPVSIAGSNDPVIYVDGIRAANTCVLEMMNAADVDRVEVYPSGVAPGGQHRNSPTGLILVYMRRSET
jgi:hypothetical protein